MALKNVSKPEAPPKVYWEDEKWLDEHITEITQKYPEMWVAVVNKAVVAWGENLSDVVNQAKKIAGHEHFPVDFIEGSTHVY